MKKKPNYGSFTFGKFADGEPNYISDMTRMATGYTGSEHEDISDSLKSIQSQMYHSINVTIEINLSAARKLASGDRVFRREVIAHLMRIRKMVSRKSKE